MNETNSKPPSSPASAVPPSDETGEADEADVRARPGRRTVEERQQAVLELFAGKATVDQIARRLGVHASTVEGWRQVSTGGGTDRAKGGQTDRGYPQGRVTRIGVGRVARRRGGQTDRPLRSAAPGRARAGR